MYGLIYESSSFLCTLCDEIFLKKLCKKDVFVFIPLGGCINFRSRPLIYPNSMFIYWLNDNSFANEQFIESTVSPFIVSTVSPFSYFYF